MKKHVFINLIGNIISLFISKPCVIISEPNRSRKLSIVLSKVLDLSILEAKSNI
jgi:hypothetical protein